MGRKVFLIDIARCNGCHNCQVSCKDEHCGADWLPYAASQPDVGQFWCKVEETVHGTVPKVNITYMPFINGQSKAIAEYAPECVETREDGLIRISPEKAKGRKDIAEAFPGQVFWNEELELPQACTGCAHLLDDGWSVPRCVDSCATGAMRFDDEENLADELSRAEQVDPTSPVYYLNVPKRWVAGEVYDPEADEVIIGATVTLAKGDEAIAVANTDEFGDFWFKQVDAACYTVYVEADGYLTRALTADATSVDSNVGAVALYPIS